MKASLTSLLLFLTALTATAQFKIIPGGFEAEDGKNYVVFNIDGSQAELYNKAKTAVTAAFMSAKDVVSYTEPTIIVINAETPNDCFTVKRVINYNFGMSYRIQMQFKDGRIRIDAPTASLTPCLGVYNPKNAEMSLDCGGSGSGGGTYHLYDKNGKCRSDKTASQIQDYINNLVNTLVDKIQGNTEDDDW